jgi:hypothetical protein
MLDESEEEYDFDEIESDPILKHKNNLNIIEELATEDQPYSDYASMGSMKLSK